MAGAEAGDRGVVRNLVPGDDPEGDILAAAPLDTPARTLTDRVRIEKQTNHHLRVEGSAAPTVPPIGGVEAAQIDRGDSVGDEPGQVIIRQPLTQTRRQQELLITVTGEEVERHQPLLSREKRVTSWSDPSRTDRSARNEGLCDSLCHRLQPRVPER